MLFPKVVSLPSFSIYNLSTFHSLNFPSFFTRGVSQRRFLFFLSFSPLHSLQRNESLDELKLIKNIWTIVKFVNLRKDREMG